MRIQFELPEERVKALEAMMREAQIPTRKDLFINALTLFDWAIKESSAGRTIASVNNDITDYKQFLIPALTAVTPISWK
jgi:hypothetical protein